jgi:FtsP/CotA-like multicopper oxidase with cupredoxin domain
MQTFTRKPFEFAGVLAVLLAVLSAGIHATGAYAAACTPTVTLGLYAKTGSTTLYGTTTATIWGYTAQPADPAGLPGPVLEVTEGDCVQVNLYNVDIPEATSLLFQGQELIPDRAGVTSGNSTSYIFSASSAGTFLYEAGLTPNGQHQVAMGLYGALIVRPSTPGRAYNDPATAFDKESVMVLSELDTGLNSSGNPAAFDMRNFSPKYFLINGKAYPGTAAFDVAAGDRVLIRYVNAGLQAHAMSTLGLSQTIVAQDGSPYSYSHKVVAETIATGQTLDTLVTIPATAVIGTRYVVFDANMLLRNNSGTGTTNSGVGGMLTWLNVASATPPGSDTSGPLLSSLALAPNPSTGTADVVLSFSANDSATGGSDVTAAEYWVDGGTAQPITVGSPAPVVSLSATIPAGLSAGAHLVSLRAQDAAGNWSATGAINLIVDNAGPTSSGLSLTPNPSNGFVSVNLSFTASDSASGGSNVTAAEYWIDAGAHQPVSVSSPAPVKTVNATIPAGLSAGPHSVSVRSQDALGNWGPVATTNLVVDLSGPAINSVSAAPNPNNGSQGLNTSVPAVRVTAAFDDSSSGGSNIAAGEGFLDTVGATGSGFVFVASDGVFNSPAESGFSDIPLPVVASLAEGNHNIYVHGKDAAGNWGAMNTAILVIDKTAPTFTSFSLTPNPTYGATMVILTVNGATDPVSGGVSSGVMGGEYWFGTTNPAPGGGAPFSGTSASIDVSALAVGPYTVNARVRDAAGNWSAIHSATLTVAPDAIFSDGFEVGNTNAWSSRSTNLTGRLNVTTGAALVGAYGLQAAGNNTNYVQYNFGTAANPSSNTFDARFYFRPNSNNSTGKDIFSAATSSTFGTTLFRVRYRLSGGIPQVQIQLGASNTNTIWTNILGGTASNYLEVVWQAAGSGGPNPGTLRLYVNGALAQTLNTTSSGSVGAFRMGSVTSAGNNTALYFDAFAAKRTVTALIGP